MFTALASGKSFAAWVIECSIGVIPVGFASLTFCFIAATFPFENGIINLESLQLPGGGCLPVSEHTQRKLHVFINR